MSPSVVWRITPSGMSPVLAAAAAGAVLPVEAGVDEDESWLLPPPKSFLILSMLGVVA
jgi:hypothetical protein